MKEKEIQTVLFISHANVCIKPEIPVPKWSLSEKGKLRHEQFNQNEIVESISSIYSSKEVKAIEAAEILAKKTNLKFTQIEALGEMDRSSTGYLAEEEFEETVNLFFKNPNQSIRGWERGIDAQNRIVKTVLAILKKENNQSGNIAIVSHGGVGALLLCKLLKEDISRKYDQPKNGGGNYFCFERSTLQLNHGWKDISKI